MEQARRYLATSAFSVGKIVELLRYSDERAFSRAFKNHFGETPGAFRKKLAPNAGGIGTKCPGGLPRIPA
jgi:AraC-like DNA-binding protein